MIAELTIECVWGRYLKNRCVKVVEFDLEDSLYDLQRFILGSVDFDCDHMSAFFVGKNPNPYSRSNIATYKQEEDDFFDDYDEEEDIGPGSYDTALSEIYPLPPKYKLYYHFDFGDDWVFSIKKGRKKPYPPVPGVKYPHLIREIGANPEQYPDWEEFCF